MSAPSILRWRALLLIWFAVVAWCTLQSAPAQVEEVATLKWYCVVCGDAGGTDVFLNLLLFFPLGLALRALGWPPLRTLALLALASVAIEVTQATLLVGRDASLGDVLSNTAGAMAGWLSLPALLALRRPNPRMAQRATGLILVVMACVWWATGAALQPSFGNATPWIGQRLHKFPGHPRFPGSLQTASMDGVDVPNDVLPATPAWRDSVHLTFDLTRERPELFAQTASLLRIVDTNQDFILDIDQVYEEAVLRARLRASDWRLRTPHWLVNGVLQLPTGEPWRVQWTWNHDRIVLATGPIGGGAQHLATVPLSIGTGWVFIHPFISAIDSRAPLWTALWLCWWFGCLGWMAGWIDWRWQLPIGAASVGAFVGFSWHWGLWLKANELEFAALAYGLMLGLSNWRKGRRVTPPLTVN